MQTSDTNAPETDWREMRRQQRHQRRVQRQAWREDHWESRVFGALTLIVIGCILLLNTTGALAWSFWLNIFRFWPLFIVSAGVSIIFSGSRWMKFIGNLLGFVIFIAVLVLAALFPFSGSIRELVPTIFHIQITQPAPDSYPVSAPTLII